jgi:hypothetical protein
MVVITLAGKQMKYKGRLFLSGRIAVALLLSLAAGNALWLILRWHGGALIALIFYTAIWVLCLRRQRFQEGIIAGVIGFGIHLIELILLGTSQLTWLDQAFFAMNLVLPIPLAITSYLSFRKGTERNGN